MRHGGLTLRQGVSYFFLMPASVDTGLPTRRAAVEADLMRAT
jgi:hypothetical protein